MLTNKVLGCSFAALAGAGAMLLAVTAADAAMLPPPAAAYPTSNVLLTAGGCGAGFHRNLAGVCRRDAVARRHCQPGFHAISFPTGNGFRCVPN